MSSGNLAASEVYKLLWTNDIIPMIPKLARAIQGYTVIPASSYKTLAERRKKRCLDFALKCAKHPKMERLFPLNPEKSTHHLRQTERFKVNFASTSSYKNSAVPYCQRLLNKYYSGEV